MSGLDLEFEWRIAGEDDDAWQSIRAFDGYFAAQKAAEIYDEVDRRIIIDGKSPVFEIRLAGEDSRSPFMREAAPVASEITRWTVWGEAEPTYYPSQVRSPAPDTPAASHQRSQTMTVSTEAV